MDCKTSGPAVPVGIEASLHRLERPVRKLASELGRVACSGTLRPRVASAAWSIGDRLSEAMELEA